MNMYEVLGAGSALFTKWLLEDKHITAKYYVMGLAFNGYEILEDEHLTVYKLSRDTTKQVSFYKK